MEGLTEEEIQFLERSILLIDSKQVTEILEELIKRQVALLSTDAGEDESIRKLLLWDIAALCSAVMQLRPGSWSMDDLVFTPSQIEMPEAETSEDPP